MVSPRAKAATKEAPMTVSTSSTMQPIILEVADAPASMGEHRMVSERAGTAGKGQSRQPAARACPVSWWVWTQRCGAGACAPNWSSAMPASSRPALSSLRAACHDAHVFGAGPERRARSAAAQHTSTTTSRASLSQRTPRPRRRARCTRSAHYHSQTRARGQPAASRATKAPTSSGFSGLGSRGWVSTSNDTD